MSRKTTKLKPAPQAKPTAAADLATKAAQTTTETAAAETTTETETETETAQPTADEQLATAAAKHNEETATGEKFDPATYTGKMTDITRQQWREVRTFRAKKGFKPGNRMIDMTTATVVIFIKNIKADRFKVATVEGFDKALEVLKTAAVEDPMSVQPVVSYVEQSDTLEVIEANLVSEKSWLELIGTEENKPLMDELAELETERTELMDALNVVKGKTAALNAKLVASTVK